MYAIRSYYVILATGARTKELPNMEIDGEIIWGSKNAMVPKNMPKSLVVIGSGAIGVEFASFYNTFGTKVTIIELMDRILPVEDEEVSALMKKELTKQGIEIKTSAKLKSLEKGKDSVTAVYELNGKEEKVTADKALSYNFV